MIIKDSKIAISNQNATIDEEIYLYKNDQNIELRFEITKTNYVFSNDSDDNLIIDTNASHFLIKMKKDELEYNFGIQPTEDGLAKLIITRELIDEDVELGDYDLQIRLYDADKCAVMTLPPVRSVLHILQPLFEDDEDELAKVNEGIVGFSRTSVDGEKLDTFDEDGNYIKTDWQNGDLISTVRMNKIEEGLADHTHDEYATENYVSNAIANAQLGGDNTEIDLSGYATKDDLKAKADEKHTHSQYLTESSLYEYAKKTDIPTVTNDLTDGLKSRYDSAYSHSQSTHAPTNAQKNSDITKAEIEAKLTGNITSHTHSQYLTEHQSLEGYATEDYVDEAVANINISGGNVDLTGYAPIDSPEFTGSISLGRKESSTVGNGSVALGIDVVASGTFGSYAEGYMTTASGGWGSHAEGNETTAAGITSHSEGYLSDATGGWSHAEGYDTTSKGDGSHTEGKCTIASSEYQHVQGKFNIEDTANKYAHIVGNGDSLITRSNAHTLDWEGNAWYQGEVYVGGTSQDDGDKLATETYVDNKFWFGTQAQYDALATKNPNTIYLIEEE